MINVTIGNNIDRKNYTLDESTVLRDALEQAEIDYSDYTIHLDGASLAAGDINKSFLDFGITSKCYLLAVVKAQNGTALKTTK